MNLEITTDETTTQHFLADLINFLSKYECEMKEHIDKAQELHLSEILIALIDISLFAADKAKKLLEINPHNNHLYRENNIISENGTMKYLHEIIDLLNNCDFDDLIAKEDIKVDLEQYENDEHKNKESFKRYDTVNRVPFIKKPKLSFIKVSDNKVDVNTETKSRDDLIDDTVHDDYEVTNTVYMDVCDIKGETDPEIKVNSNVQISETHNTENDVITDSNSFNQIITTQIIETSETKLIINNASQVNLIKSKRKTPSKVIKRKGQSLLKTSNVPKVQRVQKEIIPDVKPHICSVCDAAFSMQKLLESHCETEHPDSTFSCDQCTKVFKSQKRLRCHVNIVHTDNPRVCPHCGKKYKTKKDFEFHVERHATEKPFQCDICNRTFAGERALKYHFRTHTKEKSLQTCGTCGKNVINLADHIYLVHSDEKRYKCDRCGAAYKRMELLKFHMNTHTGERPYKCTQCDKSYNRPVTLRNHMITHNSDVTFQCEVCSRTFTFRSALKRHLRKVHGQ